MSRRVFVGNLSYASTAAELKAMFEKTGEVVEVHLPLDRNTGQPRGFAFVELSSPEQAEKAIEQLNGEELGGRALRVDAAHDRPPRSREGGSRGGSRDGGGERSGGNDWGGGGGGDWGGGGGGGRGAGKVKRGKGSRRGLRGKKRSL